MRINKQKVFLFLTTLFAIGATATGYAKPVNLYDQPNATAKVVGTVDSNSSLVPIFSNKSGDWMKVGDPKNGNVGWIRVSDFSDSKAGSMSSGFSMTEQTINTSNGPKTYRTIQFGTPANSVQGEAVIKQFQAEQAALQKNTQKMMEDFYKDMNTIYKGYPVGFNQNAFPVFMPVIVIPSPMPQTAPPAAKTPVSDKSVPKS